MDNSSGLTYVITRLIVLTNVLILCMLINSKLVIYILYIFASEIEMSKTKLAFHVSCVHPEFKKSKTNPNQT